MLGWWELPEDEQPPPEIWGVDNRIKEWWLAVDQIRKDKFKKPGEQMETVPLQQNEYAMELLKNL